MKKLYLAGLAFSVALGAMAQQAIQKEAPLAPARLMSDQEYLQTEQGKLDAKYLLNRNTPAQRTGLKAPGDIIVEEDFDGGFNGWYPDTINRPEAVNADFKFVWDTDFTRGSLMGAAAFNAPSVDNGSAYFNANFIRENNPDITAIESPCWAGLVSPSFDFSELTPNDIPNTVLSFYNVYRHCCKFDLVIGVDISFDGGTTFPVQNRQVVRANGGPGEDRNIATPADNQSVINIGAVLANAVANGTPLNDVVFRFVWDSELEDTNGQTSTEYYWAIDDILVQVSPLTDLSLTDAYYGDTFYTFDYRQVPQGMLKGYPMSAAVINNGSEASTFTCTVEFTNEELGETLTYDSDPITLGAFSDSTFVFETFTDYDPNTDDYVGTWSIRYWITADAGNPDFSVDAKDTISNIVDIFVTEATWSHARPWTGGVYESQQKFDDGTYPATPYLARYNVPSNVDSIEVSGVSVAYYDDTEDVIIGLPNQISLTVDSGVTPDYSNTATPYIYFNEDEFEEEIIFLNEDNRARRITQGDESEPDIIFGDILEVATGNVGNFTLKKAVNPSDVLLYWVKSAPSEVINLVAGGVEDDNASLFFGPFASGGDPAWFAGGAQTPAPFLNFTVDKVWIDGVNQQTSVEEQELAANQGFTLDQNQPNPFNGNTTIGYNLVDNSNVALTVINIAGKTVVDFPAEQQTAGRHSYTISADELNSGIYFYTLTVDGKSVTKKMVVNK